MERCTYRTPTLYPQLAAQWLTALGHFLQTLFQQLQLQGKGPPAVKSSGSQEGPIECSQLTQRVQGLSKTGSEKDRPYPKPISKLQIILEPLLVSNMTWLFPKVSSSPQSICVLCHTLQSCSPSKTLFHSPWTLQAKRFSLCKVQCHRQVRKKKSLNCIHSPAKPVVLTWACLMPSDSAEFFTALAMQMGV